MMKYDGRLHFFHGTVFQFLSWASKHSFKKFMYEPLSPKPYFISFDTKENKIKTAKIITYGLADYKKL